MDTPIYIVSYKNEERKQRMINRFKNFNIKFTKEVEIDDDRLSIYKDKDIEKRTWSIMLQHLDSMRDFYDNTNSKICIICEDDIHISKTMEEDIEQIIKDFFMLKLDVLMLGYLCPFKIAKDSFYFPLLHENSNYKYHTYPNDIWGTQMYMISRDYAKYLLDFYTVSHAYETKDTHPYSPDWIITKNGKRALINPMIAVEEGINLSDCDAQKSFHKRCFEANFDKEKYI